VLAVYGVKRMPTMSLLPRERCAWCAARRNRANVPRDNTLAFTLL